MGTHETRERGTRPGATTRFGRVWIAVACTSAAACSTFARNDTTPPRPEPLGTPFIANADTSFVVRESGYALIARSYAALWNTKYVLTDAAMDFRNLFGAEPPTIVVVVRDSGRAPAPAVPPALASNPLVTLTVAMAPREGSAGRFGPSAGYGFERRLAPLLARAWVQAYGDSLAAMAGGAASRGQAPIASRSDSTSKSTSSAARRPATAGSVSATTFRFAPWFQVGATTLLASPDAREAAIAAMRRRMTEAMPLATLFATTDVPQSAARTTGTERGATDLRDIDERGPMPPGMGGSMRGMHSGQSMSGPDIRALSGSTTMTGSVFTPEATSLVTYLASRGGPLMLSVVAEGLAHGETMQSMLDRLPPSTPIPHDVAQLEADWRRWLKAQPAPRGGR